MRGENLSEELKANIIFEHEKHGAGGRKIAKKFGVDKTTMLRVMARYNEALESAGSENLSENLSGEFREIEVPDENLQNDEQKIAFYMEEAKKYKTLAKELEKKLGLTKKQKDVFFAQQVKILIENLKCPESSKNQEIPQKEFLEFFEKISDKNEKMDG